MVLAISYWTIIPSVQLLIKQRILSWCMDRAHVITVPKRSNLMHCNCRSISLLFCKSDIFEKLLFSHATTETRFIKSGIKNFCLKKIGITGRLCAWIESYLSNRTQNVINNGVKSHVLKLSEGLHKQSIPVYTCSYLYIVKSCM